MNQGGKATSESTTSKPAGGHNGSKVREIESRQPSEEAQNIQRLLHEKFVAQRRKDALSAHISEEGLDWGQSRSKKTTTKPQNDNKVGASKQKPIPVKKRRRPPEAAVEPSTQSQGTQPESRAVTTASKIPPEAAKKANTTEKIWKKQKKGASSEASTITGPSAKRGEDGTAQPMEAISSDPDRTEHLKDRFQGVKEALTSDISASQHPSSPVEQQPVKQKLSSRRIRRKELRARTKQDKKTAANFPTTEKGGKKKEKKKQKQKLADSRRVSLPEGKEGKGSKSKVRRVTSRLEIQKVGSVSPAKEEPTEVKGRRHPSGSKLARTKNIQKINPRELNITALDLEQPPVPHLSYGLERVLFNPGVYHLQDPRSRVYNFDPYLQTIMPVKEFDFNALKEYITSSRDTALQVLAESYNKRYVGSSSSMTGVLAHFHFLLSQWRVINTKMLSREFPDEHIKEFTELQRCPTAIFLKWRNGSYAIDADKEFANANVLMLLGKSMEKLLTLDTEDFEKYRKSSPDKVPDEERKAPEAYHYSTMGDFIMRSQLDAHDPRLPGTGMFDLKTRAVVSVRMEASKYEEGSGYQIKSRQGAWESFEREYFDMIRAAFLKYSLQVRMGRMDGIFVAFHNTDRIFGFQYVSLPEMDSTLHGQWDTNLGDQEFKLSVTLLNDVLNKATNRYPNTSLRLHFETRKTQTPFMYIFVEPVTEKQITAIQTARDAKIQQFEEELYGNKKDDDESEGEDHGWENLQANVQDAMDEDIRDPNHEDGRQELNPVLTNPEQGNLAGDPASETHNTIDRGESANAAAIEDDEGTNDELDEDKEPNHKNVEETGIEDAEDDSAKDEVDLNEDEADDEVDQDAESRQLNGKDANRYAIEGLDLEGETCPEEAAAFEKLGAEEKGDGSKNESDESPNDTEETGYDEMADTSSAGRDALESFREGLEASPGQTAAASQSDNIVEGQASVSGDESSTSGDSPPKRGMPQDLDRRSSDNEVLALTLAIRNKVNGSYVLRPVNLRPKDKWTIEYTLDEEPDAQRAWKLYRACQVRRKKKLSDDQVRGEDDNQVDHYIRRLRQMSREGAEWRKKQDKEDRKLPVKVLGKEVHQDKGM
ncbi:MAG: hypothetical protein Q9225_004342 [Loekoesia sp. 1 TL-2023]